VKNSAIAHTSEILYTVHTNIYNTMCFVLVHASFLFDDPTCSIWHL